MKQIMTRDNDIDQNYIEQLNRNVSLLDSSINNCIPIYSTPVFINPEEEIINNINARKSLCNRVDILSRVKRLILMPDNVYATRQMVADYYEVDVETIKKLVQNNLTELKESGLKLVSSDKLISYKNSVGDSIYPTSLDKYIEQLSKTYNSVYLFNRRVILNIGMLLRDSIVAKKIRYSLLNMSENPIAIRVEEENINDEIQELKDAIKDMDSIIKKQNEMIKSMKNGIQEQNKINSDNIKMINYQNEYLKDFSSYLKSNNTVLKILMLINSGLPLPYLLSAGHITEDEYELYINYINNY